MVMRSYTYRQNLDLIKACSDSLDPHEVDLTVGGNMACVEILETSCAQLDVNEVMFPGVSATFMGVGSTCAADCP